MSHIRKIICITKWNVKQWKQINEISFIYKWCTVLFQHQQSYFPIMVHNWCKKCKFYPNRENERKSEQAHTPHAPTLLENAAHNEGQFHALVMAKSDRKIIID